MNTVSAAPQLSSAPIGSLVRAVSQGKFAENLLLKMPYKFKKSYRGTPEPQTPRMHPGCTDPLLKKTLGVELSLNKWFYWFYLSTAVKD
jgi:hypothetical protein